MGSAWVYRARTRKPCEFTCGETQRTPCLLSLHHSTYNLNPQAFSFIRSYHVIMPSPFHEFTSKHNPSPIPIPILQPISPRPSRTEKSQIFLETAAFILRQANSRWKTLKQDFAFDRENEGAGLGEEQKVCCEDDERNLTTPKRLSCAW